MTDRRAIALALGGIGCADAAMVTRGGDAEPFFVISGPVDAGVEVSGEHTRAAVAWAVWADGGLTGVVDEVPFEPRVLEYALAITGPPRPGPLPVAYGPLDGTDVSVSWGLPLLVEGRGEVDLQVDPERLADWVLGRSASLGGAFTARSGVEPVGVTAGHVLAVLSPIGRAARLGEAPGWTAGGPACRADAVVPGLTLYRDDGGGCAGWQPIAFPGERTEFQGIPVASVP